MSVVVKADGDPVPRLVYDTQIRLHEEEINSYRVLLSQAELR